jgi:membrane-bound serine protease (ClpP class)
VNRIYAVILTLLAALLVPSPVCLASGKPSAAKVMVIPVHGEIATPQLYILRKGLKQAIEQNVETVILDMNTPGGRIDTTFEIIKAIDRFPGKTVTFINDEAVSAGALISAGTDEIHFAPDSVIGAAAPVQGMGEEISATMKEKIVSYLKARVRSISEGKGHRGEVVSAMIDSDVELKIGEQILKPKGVLLSLTASEAMKPYGDPPLPLLGAGISQGIDELATKLSGGTTPEMIRYQVTWSERLAQYLTAISPILMGLGMLALFIEFKAPGFGFFGIAGIVLMGVVFLGHYVAGLSGHEPLLFFLLGAALVAVEVFLFPGTLVPALSGAALMFGSLVWAMLDHWPGQPVSISGDALLPPLASLMTGVVIAVVLFLALLRFLPKGGLWCGMVLQTSVGGEPASIDDPHHASGGLIGRKGIAVTALFPSGKVEIDGKRYEAKLAVGFADAGAKVTVTDAKPFGLIVEVMS